MAAFQGSGAFQVSPAFQTGLPVTSAVVVGGGLPGTRKKRSVVINGKPYIGTEQEIEWLLFSLLDAEEETPVQKPKKRARKDDPVELEVRPRELPLELNEPVYKALVKESFLQHDPWLTYLLREIARRIEEEEDDLEVILWAL